MGNVIFPDKMTPIKKVWSWSLGGQVILTEICIFRTHISIVLTTFSLGSPKCHFSHQDDPLSTKSEVGAWEDRG